MAYHSDSLPRGAPPPLVLTHHQVINSIYSMSTDDWDNMAESLSEALQFPSHLQQPPRQTLISGTTTTLVMPCTYGSSTSVKTVSIPQGQPPKATLTLHNAYSGSLRGVISADELTAFRTALTSLLPLRRRLQTSKPCKTVLIFGTGRIAYWTSYLLTTWPLDGSSEIAEEKKMQITIIGRGTTQQLSKKVNAKTFPDVFRHLKVLSGTHDGRVTRLALMGADAVFCCTPSTEPLFPGDWLDLGREGRRCYISLIGSYKPEMMEIEPSLLLTPGVQVVVDQKEACLAGSGELIGAGLKEGDVVEIGEVWKNDLELRDVVVFKCVGLAVMDNVAGEELLKAARGRKRGVSIEGYEPVVEREEE